MGNSGRGHRASPPPASTLSLSQAVPVKLLMEPVPVALQGVCRETWRVHKCNRTSLHTAQGLTCPALFFCMLQTHRLEITRDWARPALLSGGGDLWDMLWEDSVQTELEKETANGKDGTAATSLLTPARLREALESRFHQTHLSRADTKAVILKVWSRDETLSKGW